MGRWMLDVGCWIFTGLLAVSATSAFAQVSATLSVQADQPGVQISSNLFGIFFEEINHAGDGGIYAEMVQNRSFEDSSSSIPAWNLLTTGSAHGQMNLDTSLPLSSTNLQALKLTMQSGAGSVAAVNSGFWGIPLAQGAQYRLGLYARAAAGFTGPLTVSLQSADGSIVYAQGSLVNLGTGWQHYDMTLQPNATDSNARLALRISQAGSVYVDFVSLFPVATYNQRTNGLRPDLMNMLVNLKPSFMRFPGGSWVNGSSLANAYHWEPTVGDPADRTERANLWGYMVSNGLGYYEYLLMCEDLGAQPLFVVNCGMDVHQNAVPTSQLGPWVQEALDAIQFANGDTNTVWGAQRAALGHPAPFNLRYMEIGNENGGSAYDANYAMFYDAIKASYPYMHLIADVWGGIPTSRPVEIMDEHYYSDPSFFMANANRYDSYSRSGPKVYVGEYAVTSGAGNGNLAGALGEAAFMTGMERNSDIVEMASYAPLFANLNNKAWNPDLIYFNGTQVYGTPSYYAQEMFSRNRGDEVLPLALSFTGNVTNPPPHGAIGVGSWNTAVEYTNIVVTSNGVPIYQSDFTSGASGWNVYNGSWSTSGGVYQQSAITTDCRSTTGSTNWSNYTITLQARKVSGSEGFLIIFNWLDDNNYTWWNIGGWNNTLDGIEQSVNGSKSLVGSQVSSDIPINTGDWYNIRIVLNGTHIQCYLNDVLVHDVYYPSGQGAPHGAVGLGTWNTQASFTNLVVTENGQTNFQSDFTSGASGWNVYNGTWSTSGGVYQQTAITTDCRSTVGNTNWSNYTITLQARKDGGNEGFLILFNWQDDNNWTWWNIGGWNNTQDAIEQMVNGSKSIVGQGVAETIQSGVWYNIRIVLNGSRIQCYLNDVLIHDVTYPTIEPLYASASYAKASGQIILKTVNSTGNAISTTLNLNGLSSIAPDAGLEQLTSGSPLDENSLASPMKVYPSTGAISDAATSFNYTFPANSLTILRLQTPPTLPIQVGFNLDTNANDLASLPDGIPVTLSSFITNSVSVDYAIEAADGTMVTNGTLELVPGTLTANIPVPVELSQPGTFFRVTLSNPVNGELGGVTRAYFVQDSLPGAPLKLSLASYPDETLVYWTEPAATLLEATHVAGPWETVTNAASPIRIPGSAATEFFRLMK